MLDQILLMIAPINIHNRADFNIVTIDQAFGSRDLGLVLGDHHNLQTLHRWNF